MPQHAPSRPDDSLHADGDETPSNRDHEHMSEPADADDISLEDGHPSRPTGTTPPPMTLLRPRQSDFPTPQDLTSSRPPSQLSTASFLDNQFTSDQVAHWHDPSDRPESAASDVSTTHAVIDFGLEAGFDLNQLRVQRAQSLNPHADFTGDRMFYDPTDSELPPARQDSDSLEGRGSYIDDKSRLPVPGLDIDAEIDNRLQESTFSEEDFLPMDDLFDLFGDANIRRELTKVFPGQDAKVQGLMRAICRNNPKHSMRIILAILSVMKKVDSLDHFIQHGLHDADLPVTHKDLKSQHEVAERSRISRKLAHTFEAWPPHWKRQEIRLFVQKQFTFLVPFFDMPGNRVNVYQIPHKRINLPFTATVQRHGMYSTVFKVQIHPAHHNYPYKGENPCFAVKQSHSYDEHAFKHEVRILEKYSGKNQGHDHLLRLLVAFEFDSKFYLVFPFADRGNLSDIFRGQDVKDPFKESDVLWMIRQCLGMTDALRNIHRDESWFKDKDTLEHDDVDKNRGRHGDIKPENVLVFDTDVEGHFRLVISDFGQSRFHSARLGSGLSMTYRAPEYDLRLPISQAYDVWSLGCLFLELISWFLLGNTEGPEKFANLRLADDESHRPRYSDDKFFNIIGGFPVVKQSVQDWFDTLRCLSRCPPCISGFLDLIESCLLKPVKTERITMEGVCHKLANILLRSQEESRYCAPAGSSFWLKRSGRQRNEPKSPLLAPAKKAYNKDHIPRGINALVINTTRVLGSSDPLLDSLNLGMEQLHQSSDLNHPKSNGPAMLKDAIDRKSMREINTLVERHFDAISQDEYAWIRELDELGFGREEISDFICQQTFESPWIYFRPGPSRTVEMKPDGHQPGCVHEMFRVNQKSSDHTTVRQDDRRAVGIDLQDAMKAVQETIGIAGIIPHSRDKSTWNGNIGFHRMNSAADVWFYSNGFKERLIHVLKQLCLAVGQFQSAGLCCDCYTILRKPNTTSTHKPADIPVEICRIPLKHASLLLRELQERDGENATDMAIEVLKCLDPSEDILNLKVYQWHLIALAVQLLCLGFLSYSRAHVGAIQPFFLDTALSRINLLGFGLDYGLPHIEGSLVRLTCLGQMIQSPVFAFKLVRSSSWAESETEAKFDVLTSVEDLLDTWGPGQIIARKSDRQPVAIAIWGGIVQIPHPATRASFTSKLTTGAGRFLGKLAAPFARVRDLMRMRQRYASNDTGPLVSKGLGITKYHWSRSDVHTSFSDQVIDLEKKMIIGSLVTVNNSCPIDEERCWRGSSMALYSLGGFQSYTRYDEFQYGTQAGNYVLLQYNITGHKIPGRSLKEVMDSLQEDQLMPYLDHRWGLQVSFCTGVARRVPLREVVADLLPILLKGAPVEERLLWEKIKRTQQFDGALRTRPLNEWLEQLPIRHHQALFKMVRRTLDLLANTGIDKAEKHMVVAWPHRKDPRRCFKIPCEKESSWTPVLTDSDDCATFAYITTKCFETDAIKCGGPNPSWKNRIPFLETAVMLHSPTLMAPTSLRHKAIHFFEKLDKNKFFVTVQRPAGAANANLVVKRLRPSLIPSEIQRRIYVKLLNDERKQKVRLREQAFAEQDFAEEVAITAIFK